MSPYLAAVLLALCAAAAQARQPEARWLAEAGSFDDDLSPTQRLRIQQQLAEALTSAALRNRLPPKATAQLQLQWPLRDDGQGRFGYHGISNFVDHDAAFPNRVRDYSCGTRSYDTASGYNHGGTDYFIWPFPWQLMDTGEIAVVAAADGIIVARADGNPDRSCRMGDAPWNAVYVRHADASVAWYGHMKTGSVTARQVGDTVSAGEYLGLVGSSGSSTGPHLHFELHDAAGRVIDPRHGSCNAAADLWSPLQPYEDPAINTLSLHTQPPQAVSCGVDEAGQPVHEQTFETDTLLPGSEFFAFASFRDHRNGDLSRFRILRPDGSEFAYWDLDLADQDQPRPFYAASAWLWRLQLPADAARGTWQYQAEFHGRQLLREFSVGTQSELRRIAVERERAATAGLVRPPPQP
jgi:murein DD-endopeptidase MepM/ murein hydrolase activator NlpD